MRPINVTLDSITWELAKQKPNFSDWVRNQLRSERTKNEVKEAIAELEKQSDYWYQKYMALAYPEGEEE